VSLTKAVAASAVGHAKARDVYPQGGFGVDELGRHCQGESRSCSNDEPEVRPDLSEP
jgi:hypothetical protein